VLLLALTVTAVAAALDPGDFEGDDGNLCSGPGPGYAAECRDSTSAWVSFISSMELKIGLDESFSKTADLFRNGTKEDNPDPGVGTGRSPKRTT